MQMCYQTKFLATTSSKRLWDVNEFQLVLVKCVNRLWYGNMITVYNKKKDPMYKPVLAKSFILWLS
jgi:hypothetical protein